MRNKIINFFSKHRIVDSHIGIWKFHMWLYLLATYFDLYLLGVSMSIHKWNIFNFTIEFNKDACPHSFSLRATLFGRGINTDKKYHQEIHRQVEEMNTKQKQALKDFKNSLTHDQETLIEQYERLR